VEVARSLGEMGVDVFAVTTVDEGVELRRAGIEGAVILLGDSFLERAGEIVAHGLTAAVSSRPLAEALSREAVAQGRTAEVQLNVDTGMGRFGVEADEALEYMRMLEELPGLRVSGVFSHLSGSFGTDEASDAYSRRQLEIFNEVLSRIDAAGLLPEMIHVASSTAFIGFPEEVSSGYINAVRVGTIFYGFLERECDWPERPTPIAEISTRVLSVKRLPAGRCISYDMTFTCERPTLIAVLPVGYAFGMYRDLSNFGHVLVNGRRAPMVGKMTLGQTMVDVTDAGSVEPGDRVVLLGPELSAYDEMRAIGRGTWAWLTPLLQHCRRVWVD
jgi:alanine racemase